MPLLTPGAGQPSSSAAAIGGRGGAGRKHLRGYATPTAYRGAGPPGPPPAPRGRGRVDRALLLAAVHQLTQNAEIHALFGVPQDALLGIADAVDKAAVEGRVLGADDQGITHKVQQLIVQRSWPRRPGSSPPARYYGRPRCWSPGVAQLVLALEIMIDVAHRAAHRLGDLLHRDILKALLVEQLSATLSIRLRISRACFFRGVTLFHRDIRTASVNGFFYHNEFWAAGQGMNAPENNKFGNFEKRG